MGLFLEKFSFVLYKLTFLHVMKVRCRQKEKAVKNVKVLKGIENVKIMKNVCKKVVYEGLLVILLFLIVNFLSLFYLFYVKKTYLRVRMGCILKLLYIGGEEKESSGACEQSRGEKSR